MNGKSGDRRDPSNQGNAAKQSQSRKLPVYGLTPQLQPQRLVGPPPLLFQLGALELESRVIAIERFLERRDDNAGQAGFDLPGKSLRGGGLGKRRIWWGRCGCRTLETLGGVAKRDHRVHRLEEVAEVHLISTLQKVFPAADLSHASRKRR